MPLVERLTTELSPDIITIEQIKAWLKIEHDLENDILENLREFASYEAFNFIQNNFEELDENGELVEKPIPFNVKLACLLLISYMYENRGDEPNAMPINIVKMLYPYKKMVGL
jgi:Phage gp6-like head-tail connector protein